MRIYFRANKGANGIKMTTAKFYTNLDNIMLERLGRYTENNCGCNTFISYLVHNNRGSNSIYYGETDSDKALKKVNKPDWIKLIKDLEERMPDVFAKAELARK